MSFVDLIKAGKLFVAYFYLEICNKNWKKTLNHRRWDIYRVPNQCHFNQTIQSIFQFIFLENIDFLSKNLPINH